MREKFLDVKIFFSPILRREPFIEKAEAVSSQNKLGNFDILPEHINFISLIYDDLVVHLLDKKKFTYKFEKGLLEVSENKVNIFLGL